MIAESQRKVGTGLNIGIPVLTFLSSSSFVPKDFSEECLTNDVFMNVRISKDSAEKLGKTAKVEMLKDAMHDIFASKEMIRDQAYDMLFDFFGYMVEDVNVDGEDD